MAWQALVSCALLGTERQAPPALAGDDALGRLLGQLDGTDRDGDLLRAVHWHAQVVACVHGCTGQHRQLLVHGVGVEAQVWHALRRVGAIEPSHVH